MKNRLTKVICVLLSLVMLFGLSSITTSAAAEESAVSSTIPDGPNANGCFYAFTSTAKSSTHTS